MRPDPRPPGGVVGQVDLPHAARLNGGAQQPQSAGAARRIDPDVEILDGRLWQPVHERCPCVGPRDGRAVATPYALSLIHISEPTRRTPISYAGFCLKKKKRREEGNG